MTLLKAKFLTFPSHCFVPQNLIEMYFPHRFIINVDPMAIKINIYRVSKEKRHLMHAMRMFEKIFTLSGKNEKIL